MIVFVKFHHYIFKIGEIANFTILVFVGYSKQLLLDYGYLEKYLKCKEMRYSEQ
jgi:hypothetical protein